MDLVDDEIKSNSNETSKNVQDIIINDDSSKLAILAIDIGTTNFKCSLYDQNLKIIHSSCAKLRILHPREGYSELDPDHLLQALKVCMKTCLDQKPSDYVIKSFGISTQRNSIILWNKATGQKYSNFILWNDRRQVDICEDMNNGFMINTVKKASQAANYLIKNHRIKSFSKFRIETSHVAPRLVGLYRLLENKLSPSELDQVLYGAIDTWLVWTISKEKFFGTEITCASSSGFYDSYFKKWSNILCYSLGIPMHILPNVYDTCNEYGHLKHELTNLLYDIPINAVIADSQSSVIGECAFDIGDCVITIGTGSFISVNVGSKPLSSNNGAYPLVAFKYLDNEISILHSPVSSAGIAIDWAKGIGLFNDYKDIEGILNSMNSSGGVYFISAFGFLDFVGVDKSTVGTGFIGIKTNTSKAQMLRSIIDSIVFSIKIKMDLLLKDLKTNNIPLKSVRISGGVSRSDFLCQYLSNLLQVEIERGEDSYSSSTYGAAFLAGLGSKIWSNLNDLKAYRKNIQIFKPDNKNDNSNYNNHEQDLENWKNALQRFSNWQKTI